MRKNIGTKDDADAERADKGRQRDFLRAIEDRLDQRLAHGHLPMDVFDLHRGVVHEDADGEREAAERHEIDRLPERAQAGERGEHAQRNGERDDDRAAPRADEEQDHDRGQRRRR